jgi:pyrroloquinoline quinone biosynthesis protein D
VGNLIDESSIIAVSPNASFQSLGDSAVILMTDSGQLFTCNETTEAFLKEVDGVHTIGDIVNVVVDQFAVDRDTLRDDLIALANELSAEGIVQAA